MSGFSVEVDALREAGGLVGETAMTAESAARDLGHVEVSASPSRSILDSGSGHATHCFGDTLGFDAIAWAYSEHLEAVREYLRKLSANAEATGESLTAVAALYRDADEAARL